MALYLNWSWMVLNNAGNNFSILRMILICECFFYLVCLEPFKRFSEEKRSRLKNVNMIVNLSPDLSLSNGVPSIFPYVFASFTRFIGWLWITLWLRSLLL